MDEPWRGQRLRLAPLLANQPPARILCLRFFCDVPFGRIVELFHADPARARPCQSLTCFKPRIEGIERKPRCEFPAEHRSAAVKNYGDFHHVADTNIGNQYRRRQPTVEYETLQIGFAAKQLKGLRLRMLNPFLATDHADEMDFDPLKSWVKLRHDMRDALCPFPGEDALDCAAMPGLLREAQI